MKYLFIFLFFVFFYNAVQAQPGTLDKSFGEGGVVVGKTYYGGCNNLIIQKDGKIISIGTGAYGKLTSGFLLVRYNTDGTPDLSFGDSGRAATQYGAGISYGAFQSDGKIVVTGVVGREGDGNNVAVVRYNANGEIDSSFGTNGLIVQSLTKQYDNPCGIVVQPDGKIVVAGATVDLSDFDAVAPTLYLVRYNEDGSHDESFGKNGIYQEEIDPITAGGLALQPDGKIIVGGDYEVSNDHAFFLKQFTSNGLPDTKYGINGEARYNFTDPINSSTMYSLILQTDGKIITAGSTYNSINNDNNPLATLVRFNTDGSIDKAFGENGLVVSKIGDYDSEVFGLAIQPDGRIVVAVNDVDINTLGSIAFAVARYTSNGELDSSFGKNGSQTTVIDNQPTSSAIALQKDGKIILGGYSATLSPYTYHVTLIRYNGDNAKQPLAVRIKRWLLHHGISWQMQPNKAVRYYAIQRSADGIVYKEIAKLSNKQQVDKYEDAAITSSSYYRLAAIGWDGSRTYSNTILIDESTSVKVFPNPVRDNLQLQGLASGKTAVSIVDLQGNVRSSSVAGGANYSVNTSQLTPGNYLLKLQHNNTTTTQPFVKE